MVFGLIWLPSLFVVFPVSMFSGICLFSGLGNALALFIFVVSVHDECRAPLRCHWTFRTKLFSRLVVICGCDVCSCSMGRDLGKCYPFRLHVEFAVQ